MIGDSHSVLLAPAIANAEPRWQLVDQVSRPGWSTARYAADDSWQAQIADGHPDIVVIVLGTNDAATSQQAYAVQLRTVIRKAAADGAVVAWVGPPSATNPSVEARVDRIASWQADMISQMGATWVDSRPLTISGQGNDGVHFTQAGYNAWAGALASVFRQKGVGAPDGVLVIPLLLVGLVVGLFFATLRGRS